MNRIFFFSLALVIALLGGCDSQDVERDSRDENYVHVKGEDAEMNAAIAQAKATFPQFVSALREKKPSHRTFGVKKPYATPSGGQEHMWIEEVTEIDGGFVGVIANEAYDTREVHYGQRVRFAAGEISDWKYVDGNVLVGGYTIRYFVNRMSPEEKKALEKEIGCQIR